MNSNKDHAHDGISIRMLKICGPSLLKAFSLLSLVMLFLTIGKKVNAFPVYKKHNKQLVSNYRPVSLLLICCKIFEKLICNCIYAFLDQNCLPTVRLLA